MESAIKLSEKTIVEIEKYLATGKYADANDVVNQGLAMLESEINKKEALAEAILEGENSGVNENFDLKAFRQQIYVDYTK